MKSEYTANGSVNEIEFDEKNPKDIIEKTSNLRQNFLSKYLSSDNLNFLISNGCSTCANSWAINVNEKESEYQKKLKSFSFNNPKFDDLTKKI